MQPDQIHLVERQLRLVRPVVDMQVDAVSEAGKNIRVCRVDQYNNTVFLFYLLTLQTAEYDIF